MIPQKQGTGGSDPNVKYGWGSHEEPPVPVYYQGDSSEVLDGLVGEGYESYGSKVPGIEGLVDQTVYRPCDAVTEGGSTAFSPKSEAEAPAESPFNLLLQAVIC